MPAPTFVSYAVMKEELGLEDDESEDIVVRLLESVTRRMQERMGRVLFLGNYEHRVDGGWRSEIYPPEVPISAVNALLDSGSPVSAAQSEANQAGYRFNAEKAWLQSGAFSRGTMNVLLQYVGGYAADEIPADVTEACILQTRNDWLRRTNINQKSQSLGPNQSVQYERNSLLPRVDQVCEDYQPKNWQG